MRIHEELRKSRKIKANFDIPHPSRTNFGLRLVYRVGLGLGLVFILSKLDYMWLKISAYLNLSPTGVCSQF